MDIVELVLEGLWDMPPDWGTLVRDVPDAASVAIVALFFGWRADDRFEGAVRARYRELTRPGEPDGPRWLANP